MIGLTKSRDSGSDLYWPSKFTLVGVILAFARLVLLVECLKYGARQ